MDHRHICTYPRRVEPPEESQDSHAAPRPETPAPELTAALVERGLMDTRKLPWVAAHWLADGNGAAGLAEFAGLHGTEPELTNAWRCLLPELGVGLLDLPVGRTVMPWAAEQVHSGAATTAWLVQALWPDHDRPDEALDRVIYQLDIAVEYAGNLREEAASPAPARWRSLRQPTSQADLLKHANDIDDAIRRAVLALAEGDLEAAEDSLKVR